MCKRYFDVKIHSQVSFPSNMCSGGIHTEAATASVSLDNVMGVSFDILSVARLVRRMEGLPSISVSVISL